MKGSNEPIRPREVKEGLPAALDRGPVGREHVGEEVHEDADLALQVPAGRMDREDVAVGQSLVVQERDEVAARQVRLGRERGQGADPDCPGAMRVGAEGH